MKHAFIDFIRNRDNDLFLWGISMLRISLSFSESLLFPVVALLNRFTKSSRFEEGFNNNELL